MLQVPNQLAWLVFIIFWFSSKWRKSKNISDWNRKAIKSSIEWWSIFHDESLAAENGSYQDKRTAENVHSFLIALRDSFSIFRLCCSICRASRSARFFSLIVASACHVKSSLASSQLGKASSHTPSSCSWVG